MENLRKRKSVKLVNNTKDYVRSINEPSFALQKIFSKNFVAIHEIKPALTLNKPIYVGFSILDLSKYFTYEIHYKYIKNNFDVKLLFADTDSLVYVIKTEDVYEDFDRDKNLFDFSDYPLDSNFFDPVNKKFIGKMKDDFKGKLINGFIGLKSKMYSVISVDDEGVTKSKGVNIKIRHKEFAEVLFNKKVIRHNMKRIQSKLHRIALFLRFHCFVLMIKDMF